MGLKGKLEAIIYAAEEPITLEQISLLMKESVLQELAAEHTRSAEAAAAEQAAAGQQPETETSAEPAVPDDGSTQGQAAEALAGADASPESKPVEPEVADSAAPTAPPAPQQEDGVPSEAAPENGEADTPVIAQTQERPSAVPSDEVARAEAAQNAPVPVVSKRRAKPEIPPEVKGRVRRLIEELIADYAGSDRGMEIRQIAGGFRMATKPEHHDIIKAFVKSLKPPLRLSMPALETLAVIAYKQPVTAPEVGEVRGVDSQGVIATLLDRKLITTAGRKAVIGRPILYKTTKDFLLRFGLKDVSELPSMEEFEKLAQDANQADIFEPDQELPATASDDTEIPEAESQGDVEYMQGEDAVIPAESESDDLTNSAQEFPAEPESETPAEAPSSPEEAASGDLAQSESSKDQQSTPDTGTSEESLKQ